MIDDSKLAEFATAVRKLITALDGQVKKHSAEITNLQAMLRNIQELLDDRRQT